jgi:hypothetical protein
MHTDWSVYGDPQSTDWRWRGYFAYPESIPPINETPEASLYPMWVDVLRRAKQGDFSGIPALRQTANGNTHPVMGRLSKDLLGDAGPDDCIDDMARLLPSIQNDCEQVMDWCSVLTRRGKLADIPVVLDALEPLIEIEDAEIIPVWISDCIEDGHDFSDVEDHASFQHYRNAVLERCAELARRYGSDQVMVLGGERISVTKLARRILERAEQPHFPAHLRRIFESSTGIDCTSFYARGLFQPRQAAARVEAFLESSRPNQFEDGVRYFFGHRVP